MKEELKHLLWPYGPNPDGWMCYCRRCGKQFGTYKNAAHSPCQSKKAVCAICNGTGMVLEPRKSSPGCDWEPCSGCQLKEDDISPE